MELPEECWELILSFIEHRHQLSSLSLVCKTFFKITNNLVKTLAVLDPTALVLPDLLRRFTRLRAIDLSRFHGDTDALLSQIANSGLEIESLDVSNRRNLPIHGLRVFAAKVKSLKALNCSKIGTFQDHNLNSIAQFFPCLEELDISYSENSSCYFGPPITDAGVRSLSENLKCLRKINLSGNLFITDKSLDFLSMNCLLLSEIVLSSCGFVTQSGIALLIERCASLNSLTACVINCSIADSTLINSLQHARALSVVGFRDSIVSNKFLCYLAESYLPLTNLVFANCFGFTSDGILYMLSCHKSLRHLDLQAVSCLCDEDICTMSTFLPNLTYINLSCCKSLADSAFFGLIRNCPLLSEIEMDGTNLGSQDLVCSTELVANHARIKHLQLGQNPSLNDECLLRIASVCPNLQTLDLSHCSNVTGRGVLEALRRCLGIQCLEMNQCGGIKSFALEFELSKLEVLSASGVEIFDRDLQLIGSRCPQILQLNLSNCLNITEVGVEHIARKCKVLREMNLKCCNKVNVNITWLVTSMPSLKKIVPPCGFVPTESQRNFYVSHGCIVCDD